MSKKILIPVILILFVPTIIGLIWFYSSTDKVLWVYTLIGYFTVNEGNFCTCYSCEYTTEIYDSNWSFSEGSSHYVGNVAYGQGKFTLKFLLIPVQNVNIDIHVQCDEYGVIS